MQSRLWSLSYSLRHHFGENCIDYVLQSPSLGAEQEVRKLCESVAASQYEHHGKLKRTSVVFTSNFPQNTESCLHGFLTSV